MTFLIIFFIIGVGVGGGMNSLMDNRGRGLGIPVSVGLGVAASLVTGFVLLNFGKLLVGEGPDSILALFGALVAAVVVILLFRLIKK